LISAAFFAPLQVIIGDSNGRTVFRHQPAKLAAMEAHWETNRKGGAPFVVVAFPDEEKEQNYYSVAIPNGLSWLLTLSPNGRVSGLEEFPPQDRPNVFLLFWTFRIMVAIGFLFCLIMLWAFILWRKNRLYEHRPFLWALVGIQPLGFLATELGWVTSEAGRQPWIVYGLMRTAEGISPIPPGNVLWSLALFFVVFPLVGGSYFYYAFKTLRQGPDLSSPIPPIQRPAGMRALQEKIGREDG
jgi:cytochrome d ubiquinol oxidase subunit I